MNFTECIHRRHELSTFLDIDGLALIYDLSAIATDLFSLAGMVVIPCLPTGRFTAGGNTSGNPILDIPIFIEDQEIGFLCLSSKLRESGIDTGSATDTQKHAILKLTLDESFDSNGAAMTHLISDCVVIRVEYLEQFLVSRNSSALWGGFVLTADASSIERCSASADVSRITVPELSDPRTARHKSALQRATESSIAVDRFLHLYHFLELDYDHEIVERIKLVDLENTTGLEKLLGTGRAELDRLLLVSEGFIQLQEIEEIAGILKFHKQIALTVFYDYGKEHNPLKEREAFEQQFLNVPAVNRLTLEGIKKTFNLKNNFAKDEASYRDVLIKLACYWIYRIRCCIAHNKLGEYHLRTASDMKFVNEFGEPLIRALITHRLRK